jgi:glutamyl-tRNA synthetase
MSKRDQGASLAGYLEQGYVPAAVVNYLCLLGWSPKDDRQLLPLPDVIARFDLPQILRANARFDMAKLQWLNFEHIKQLDPAGFRAQALPILARAGIDASRHPVEYVDAALATCREKIKVFADLPPFADFYFLDEFEYDPEVARKEFVAANEPRVVRLREALRVTEPFDATRVQETFKAVAVELGVKVGVLVHPARLACTGRAVGPSLYHLIEVLGRERVLARLDRALARGFGAIQ